MIRYIDVRRPIIFSVYVSGITGYLEFAESLSQALTKESREDERVERFIDLSQHLIGLDPEGHKDRFGRLRRKKSYSYREDHSARLDLCVCDEREQWI